MPCSSRLRGGAPAGAPRRGHVRLDAAGERGPGRGLRRVRDLAGGRRDQDRPGAPQEHRQGGVGADVLPGRTQHRPDLAVGAGPGSAPGRGELAGPPGRRAAADALAGGGLSKPGALPPRVAPGASVAPEFPAPWHAFDLVPVYAHTRSNAWYGGPRAPHPFDLLPVQAHKRPNACAPGARAPPAGPTAGAPAPLERRCPAARICRRACPRRLEPRSARPPARAPPDRSRAPPGSRARPRLRARRAG
jgi:hypothetical protein